MQLVHQLDVAGIDLRLEVFTFEELFQILARKTLQDMLKKLFGISVIVLAELQLLVEALVLVQLGRE